MTHSPSSSEQDLIELLKLAGPEWMSDRVWKAETLQPSDHELALQVEGPAFCYRWEIEGSQVNVAFIPSGTTSIAPGLSRLMVIEVGRGTIRVHIPGRDPQIIGALSPAIYQQIAELVTEAQNAIAQGLSSWNTSMSLIAGSMRMATLTLEAATAAAAPERGGKRSPKKDQLVTQLHEWLRPNLGNSVKLADAAKRFDKSPRQLIRILKETTGAGFAEHLTMHRLTLARSLLMRSDQSVREVAKAAGFNSREQFIRSFNKAFSWTPLQFRKAWNRASLSESDLETLCKVSGRSEVTWTPPGETALTPEEGSEGAPHTVVVANALHEIVELFWVSPQGKQARIDVLEHGGMAFVNRDSGGSAWVVRAPSSGLERFFVTPDDHSLAIVSRELAS
ncbi:AraC family transcriptional regulator [Haloferula rosea]|nr:AraC family transcriptional regulator [Haloferula rosea]